MDVQENELLTRVGPGTPMGELLRRYWWPVGFTQQVTTKPVPVRILCEDLVLFRDPSGKLGLIDRYCAHRRASLEFGRVEEHGIRCCYHGWKYDHAGQCIDTPLEPETSKLKDGVKLKGYDVEEAGGLVFAYLGPEPVPLLPRWDVVTRPDLDRGVQIHMLPCNWLQCMDNSADPVHFEYLHAALGNYTLKKQGKPPAMKFTRHLKIGFDRFKYGLMKRRLLEGESEDSTDWTIGHPLLFPNILAQGAKDSPTLQFRTPVDDTHTLHFGYRTRVRAPGAAPKPFTVVHEDLFDANGKVVPNNIPQQDMLAWVSQGPISDRANEHLAASDSGITLYRRMLNEALDAVARGEDPIGVVRDRAENEPWIDLHREDETLKAFDSKYKGLLERVNTMAGAAE